MLMEAKSDGSAGALRVFTNFADHFCWTMQGNGGRCDQSLDGTYIYSADGLTRTLFYKLAGGSSVVAYL